MNFGRIYSVWDRKYRMFVYVGQTIRQFDLAPHGRAMRKAWDNHGHRRRYVYCVEREWESVSVEDLNRQECRFIFRRRTFRDLNPCGMNFTGGGGGYGKQSAESNAKNRENVRVALADPVWKAGQGERVKARWQNPEWRNKTIAKMKARLADPEFAEKRRLALVAALNRPEVRMRNSAVKKIAFSAEGHRARLKELGQRPESVENMRRASRIGHENAEHVAKRIAGIRLSKRTAK